MAKRATDDVTTDAVDVYVNPGSEMDFASLAQSPDVADSAEELGDGFVLLDEKDSLIGVDMVITDWRENLGDFGPYYSATAVLSRPVFVNGAHTVKVRINDGGHGFRTAFEDRTRPQDGGKMLRCRNGLRKSEYTNEHGPAVTWYIG